MFLRLALYLVPLVNAFGFIGHRFSAALLWDLLPHNIRHQCLGFPTNSSHRLNKLNFIRLACRPDRIKHRPGMEWAQPLHFFNTKDYPPVYCQPYEAFLDDEGPNLVQAARNYTFALQDVIDGNDGEPLSKDQQAQVLSFMVHFLTDLHQPLHVSARLQGGNQLRVLFDGKLKSLHSLWDSHLLAKFLHGNSRWKVKRTLAKHIKLIRMSNRDELGHQDRIAYWAAETNLVNCKVVWNFDRSCDLAGAYYCKSIPVVLELIALSALRTLHLLEAMCQ